MAIEMFPVPVDRIKPNPWNPNRMDDRTYAAERESIREYGFIDPVAVRLHPAKGKAKKLVGTLAESNGAWTDEWWQILDGEHRTRAAVDEGYTEVPVTPLESRTEPLPDGKAKKLTVILNETRGDHDVVLLGRLLAEMQEEMDEAELRLGLPYSQAELAHLTDLGKVDWTQFDSGAGQGRVTTVFTTVSLPYTDADYERFTTLVQTLAHEQQTEGLPATVLAALEAAAAAVRA